MIAHNRRRPDAGRVEGLLAPGDLSHDPARVPGKRQFTGSEIEAEGGMQLVRAAIGDCFLGCGQIGLADGITLRIGI